MIKNFYDNKLVIPVVIYNKVLAGTTADGLNATRKNLLVPKASILSVIGKELNVERERDASTKSTAIYADIFVGFEAIKEGIVFNG